MAFLNISNYKHYFIKIISLIKIVLNKIKMKIINNSKIEEYYIY